MLSALNDFLWGQFLIVALIAVGLFFTVYSRFVQFRYFGRMFGVLRSAMHRETGHISSFQALLPGALAAAILRASPSPLRWGDPAPYSGCGSSA